MAKITQSEKLLLSRTEAHDLIKNADGRVRFMFRVSAFLPIDSIGGKGFESVAFLTVSRKDAQKLVLDLLSETLQARGGKLCVETSAPRSERDLTFITIA
jgi:hypothetical protein